MKLKLKLYIKINKKCKCTKYIASYVFLNINQEYKQIFIYKNIFCLSKYIKLGIWLKL